MASVHRTNPDAPMFFGYEIDNVSLQNAPDPPSGAPLLSDNEQQALYSFLEDRTFDAPVPTSLLGGPTHSESWMDLPPKFMGSASFFGQQQHPSFQSLSAEFQPLLTADSSAFSMSPPPPPPPPSQTQTNALAPAAVLRAPPVTNYQHSADVLEAASVLQNGSLVRPGLAYDQHLSTTRPNHVQPLSTLAHDGFMASPVQESNPFSAMTLLRTNGGQTAPPPQLRWGSDQNFNQVQFIPQSEKDTTEALESARLQSMQCLEVSQSTDTTRASSPVYASDLNQLILTTHRNSPVAVEPDRRRSAPQSLPPLPPPPPPPPPRKRRRDKVASVDMSALLDDSTPDDDEMSLDAGAPPRKRRSRVSASNGSVVDGASQERSLSPSPQQQRIASRSSSSAAVEGPPKRRRTKSTTTDESLLLDKTPRKNLTEGQKRQNHIDSEQKRRSIIRVGFQDLCTLVPSLRGGGFSKSVILSMATDWLEGLLQGNEQLREQLRAL